jgi:AraC family transcriptional regulator
MLSLHELPQVPMPEQPLLAVGFAELLIVHLRQPAFATEEHTNPYPQVCIKLGQAHQQTETIQGRSRTTTALPGSVGLYPANLHYAFAWDKEAEFLQIYLSPTLVSRTSVELFGDDRSEQWQAVTNGHDPLVLQLGLALRSAAQGPSSQAHTAMLARALTAHLLARAPTGEGGIPGRERYAFENLIGAMRFRMAHPWTVPEMAAFVGLSQHHFSRRFQEKVGLAPYQFLLRIRIERAAELLGGSTASVADIAQQVGFSHQGHLNHHFKKLVGQSPIAFRRESRYHARNSTIQVAQAITVAS